jgi:tape measure domain-containing protein
MASPATEFTIKALVSGLEQVEGLKSAVRSLQNTAQPAAADINKLRDAAKSLGNAAEASTSDLRTSVTVLKSLKDQVALTSKEYRDLSNDLKTVENRFNAANTAAKQFKSSAGSVSGGTAGAAIMGRPAERLEPAPRLGFQTNDPEYWRRKQQNIGGPQLGPQQLDYEATTKGLTGLELALDQMNNITNRGHQEKLQIQEKYNQLEIERQDAAFKKQQAQHQQQADIAGRDFLDRVNNAASIREKAEQRIAQRRQRLATAGQTVGAVAAAGVFGGPEGALGATIGAFGGPGGALVGGAIGAQVGMLRQSIGDTATYSSEITKLNIALKGVTKTSDEYAAAQNAISSISTSLNVPIKEATAGFTKLSASVIGAGGNVNDAEIVMRGFTQAIKATGGGAEQVAGAMTALTQIFSKGKVSAEEINQIAERLPGAFTAIAKASGKTGPELQKALENGEVGLNDLMKTAQYLTDQYGASAAKMAASTEESGARMTVALDKIKFEVGQAFQPIGSEFQESIIKMANASVAALKTFKEKIDESNKSIANLIGNDNLKGIQSFFQTIVSETLASIDPLTRAYLLLQKISELSGFIPKGDPNLTPQELGKTGYAGRYPIPVKPPSNFPGPKPDGDDKAAKKEAKLKQQIELQRELNDIESQFNAYELPRLKSLQETQLQLAALDKDANVEAKKKLQLRANELEYQLDAFKISKQQNIEIAKSKTIEDQRLQYAQLQGIDVKAQSELKKLGLTRDQKRKAIEQGVTLELKEREKVTAKQLTDSQRLFLVLQDQLAIARATTPEEKIRLESKARINELDRDTVELNVQQQDQAVRLQNTENLKSQILLEQINLKERLAALDPLQQFITQSTTQLENLKGVAVSVSQSIGEALGNSVSSGIQGLVEGTANAQQIFSDFLKSIGQILIQEGAKMIATYTAIAIAKSLAGLFGGGSSAIAGGSTYGGAASSSIFSAGTGTAFGGMSIPGFAAGGIPPIGRPSLVGEKGPELFVPRTSGTIVPADATAAAMARYQRQGGSSSGNSSSDAMGAAESATPVLSMSFETTRFLGQDYVSTDQLQAAMMATEKRAATAGAKAGAAQVSSQMRNSPAYRRQVGLR